MATFINFKTVSKIPELFIFHAENTRDKLPGGQINCMEKNKERIKSGGWVTKGVKKLSVYSKQGFKCNTNKK